jgi:inositol-pentakisphosphate 2-kinase
LQSPNAPLDAVRCRNCAVQLFRRLREPHRDARPKPCPLLLVSDSWQHRRSYLAALSPDEDPGEWFRGNPGTKARRLLTRLRDLQQDLDQDGPLGVGEDSQFFPLAMTLRDCSVFLQIFSAAEGSEHKVVARLADLDKKNASAKLPYWRRTEQELIEHGAYTAEYRLDSKSMRAVPVSTGCLLELDINLPAEEVPVHCSDMDHDKLIRKRDVDHYQVR